MKSDKKIIMVDGQSVEVTDEVYEVYTKGERKMRYMEQDLKTEKHVHTKENDAETVIPSREDSLERLSEEKHIQFYNEADETENVVIKREEYRALAEAMLSLDEDERKVITAIFFENLTIRKTADRLGMSRMTVQRIKEKSLEKMKKFF